MTEPPFILPGRDRFERHRRISWWDQDLLGRSVALVAGCGALGNEVAKNLALVGVGTVILVDFDRIEASNLVRSVLFRPGDEGRFKAEVAAERLGDLYPQIRAIALVGDLRCDVGLGLLRRADLVLGCLDSIQARFALNRLAMRAPRAWLDGGLGVEGCQVALHDPSEGACYECQTTPDMARRFAGRYSCSGLARPEQGPGVPTTAITASLAAALMVQEGLIRLHRSGGARAPDGGLEPGCRLTLHLSPHRLVVDRLPVDPDCCAHGALPGRLERAGRPDTLCAADLLGPGDTALELGFDLVTRLDCPRCGPTEACLPRPRLDRTAALCPSCGSERAVDWLGRIEPGTSLARRTLRELGVPDHHVIRVEGARPRDVELGGTVLEEASC